MATHTHAVLGLAIAFGAGPAVANEDPFVAVAPFVAVSQFRPTLATSPEAKDAVEGGSTSASEDVKAPTEVDYDVPPILTQGAAIRLGTFALRYATTALAQTDERVTRLGTVDRFSRYRAAAFAVGDFSAVAEELVFRGNIRASAREMTDSSNGEEDSDNDGVFLGAKDLTRLDARQASIDVRYKVLGGDTGQQSTTFEPAPSSCTALLLNVSVRRVEMRAEEVLLPQEVAARFEGDAGWQSLESESFGLQPMLAIAETLQSGTYVSFALSLGPEWSKATGRASDYQPVVIHQEWQTALRVQASLRIGHAWDTMYAGWDVVGSDGQVELFDASLSPLASTATVFIGARW